MILCGIDPGLRGGIAFANAKADGGLDTVETFLMPTLSSVRNGKTKNEIDPHAVARLIKEHMPGHAFIEIVGAMPAQGTPDSSGKRRTQGTSSAFAFGKGYGIIIGILAALGVPYTFVASTKWKAAMGATKDKDGSRARASQLMPDSAGQWKMVKEDGRAESALLVLYGHRMLSAIGRS